MIGDTVELINNNVILFYFIRKYSLICMHITGENVAYVETGEKLILPCKAEMLFATRITWQKYSQGKFQGIVAFKTGHAHKFLTGYTIDVHGSLTILNVQQDANYTCEKLNKDFSRAKSYIAVKTIGMFKIR